MKLTVEQRGKQKKGTLNDIRRKGGIPAVLYAKGRPGEPIVVDSVEFNTHMRSMKSGRLPTTVFTLVSGNKQFRAIIKDIQRNIITYQVSHIDFEEIVDNVPVSLKVPITLVGIPDCVGVKLGGILRQVIRYVKVQCLPQLMPTEFTLDVKDLGIKQKKRLSELQLPEGVKPLANMAEVVVVVAKGKG
jgi:large subunit ribosomal protein L25